MGTTTTSSDIFNDPVLTWVRENTYGYGATIPGPYGPKKRRYFDFTASGQSFKPIEEMIEQRVLPFMANTHAMSSYSAELMTKLFKEAHEKVRRALRCREDDVVIFTGQGCTSAVSKLVSVLGIRIPDTLQNRYDLLSKIPPEERPVVIRTRMEHHSNDLPWRETIADCEMLGYDDHGRADWRALDKLLSSPQYRDRPLKIGTFSAASNATGVLNDTKQLAAVMHDHGGVAFFDFAASAPYIDVDLHPENDDRYRKDAVFMSMHKFAGGPQSPGVLVCNKAMIRTEAPADPGGGTVLYTAPWNHFYTKDLQNREEGGTPQIIQSIRAGLAWELREMIGTERMMALEHACIDRVVKAWRGHPKIKILGPDPLTTPRLGNISMLLDNMQLHYNMAVRILSDRWGIQVRGGCMCAHTYGHDLLNIDRMVADIVQSAMRNGNMTLKPGYVRVSFGPSVSPEDMDVLVEALPDLVENWKKYAEDYVFNWSSGDVFHKSEGPMVPDFTLQGPPSTKRPASAPARGTYGTAIAE